MIFALKYRFHYGNELPSESLKSRQRYYWAKKDLILSNRDKYSINAMCKLFKVPRSLVYYNINKRAEVNKVSEEEVWNYICTLSDLHNKEAIGYSTGVKEDTDLVYEAFLSCNYPLAEIKIFHTDTGNEFKNIPLSTLMKEALEEKNRYNSTENYS
mgnify:CR=1 FL=1